MFLVQGPVLGLSHACSERLRLRSYFVDVCQTEFSLATEISVFLILISLIFVIAFWNVAVRFVSLIGSPVTVQSEGIGARLPHAGAKPMVILVRASLKGDWVGWVAVHQVVERSQTIKAVNLCKIVIRDLVSLIFNLLNLIFLSLVFLFCASVLRLGHRWGQLSQLRHLLGQRPGRLALNERGDGRDGVVGGFSRLHDVSVLAVDLLVLPLILIWLIGMESWGAVTHWRALADLWSRRALFDGH